MGPGPAGADAASKAAGATRQRGGGRAKGAERRRVSHSLEAVLDAAVALLDAEGVQALTFRALAAELGGGAASVYWYVSSKDELLDRAADHVLADVLERVATAGVARASKPSPSDADGATQGLRTIAVTLFDAIVRRPWLSAYFLRDTGVQPHALRLYELLGQQLLGLDLTARQRFHAVSAVVGFVVGTAADMTPQQSAPSSAPDAPRDAHLQEAADQWRALDPADFPFVHSVVEEFATHDDSEQFRAGLDLLLAGLRQQAKG